MQDAEDEVCILEQVESYDGKETLGVILAGDGNNRAMIQKMRQKAEEWRKLIRSGHLEPSTAWHGMNSTILRTLYYPLPALTLTKEECRHIMAPVLQAGLNAAHMSKNLPRDLVYGHIEEGGLGVKDIYHEQGVSHLYYLTKHLEHDGITGKLLRCTLEAAMVELGSQRQLFSLDYNRYSPILTDCWIKCAWKYVFENGINFQQHVATPPKALRECDIAIMDAIIQSGRYSKLELQ